MIKKVNRIVPIVMASVLTTGITGCGGTAASDNIATDNNNATEVSSENTAGFTDKEEEITQTQSTTEETSEDGQTSTEDTDISARGTMPSRHTNENGLPEILGEQDIIEVPERDEVEIPDNEAMEFVRNLELGWNLGNTFEAYDCANSVSDLEYESAWSNAVTTKEMIHTISESCFNTLRIPISWHNHLVDENYTISEDWMKRVQEVVDWALDEDMYVIINIHHDDGPDFIDPTYDNLESSKDFARTIWEQIAGHFADYDERLIFETMNEPRKVGSDIEWWIEDVESDAAKEGFECINEINQTIVDTIRESGGKYNSSRYILVPGYCAKAMYTAIPDFKLPNDDKATAENRLLVSIHEYTPYDFALADESETRSVDDFSIDNVDRTKEIDNFMKDMYDSFISKGVGVVIGEFGARNKNENTEARTEFAAYYTAQARHYGMTAMWWDNNLFEGDNQNFGLLKRSDCTFVYPEIVTQMVYYSRQDK